MMRQRQLCGLNERTETLLDAQAVTLYPQLELLDAMMASIVIK